MLNHNQTMMVTEAIASVGSITCRLTGGSASDGRWYRFMSQLFDDNHGQTISAGEARQEFLKTFRWAIAEIEAFETRQQIARGN